MCQAVYQAQECSDGGEPRAGPASVEHPLGTICTQLQDQVPESWPQLGDAEEKVTECHWPESLYEVGTAPRVGFL